VFGDQPDDGAYQLLAGAVPDVELGVCAGPETSWRICHDCWLPTAWRIKTQDAAWSPAPGKRR